MTPGFISSTRAAGSALSGDSSPTTVTERLVMHGEAKQAQVSPERPNGGYRTAIAASDVTPCYSRSQA
jgi:hypothetical protein